jgi:hypothetical protein
MLKTQLTRIAFTILAVSMLCSIAWADGVPTLTLDPTNGAISGAPGATIGWGFTITNATDFLVVSSSDFCVGAITSPCSNGLGTYADFIGPQFQVVGPSPESTSLTQALDLLAQTGMGSFTINPGALPGDSVTGEIVVTYDLFSVDPNSPTFNPTLDTVSTGDMLTAGASVSVPGATAVPEPSSLILLGSGLLALFGVTRRNNARVLRPSA